MVDVGADVEGEQQCGSSDVEDRNVLARQVLHRADLVLVVGVPGVAGFRSQLRVLGDLLGHGVAAGRIVPVVNRARGRPPAGRAPRRWRNCSRLAARHRAGVDPGVRPEAAPVDWSSDRAAPLPGARGEAAWSAAVLGCSSAPVTRRRRPATDEPVLVAPGSLGSWADGGVEY